MNKTVKLRVSYYSEVRKAGVWEQHFRNGQWYPYYHFGRNVAKVTLVNSRLRFATISYQKHTFVAEIVDIN